MKTWIDVFTDEDGLFRARVEMDGQHPKFPHRFEQYGPYPDAAGLLRHIAEDMDADPPESAQEVA